MPEPLEDLARAALAEITPVDAVGEYLGQVDEGDGVVSLLLAPTMPGYPGWKWTVSIAHVEGAEPTVLEAELMPAEGALLSPDWVPWADRLAEYQASQEALEAAAAEADADDDDSDDDDLDGDPDDDDEAEDDLDDHVMDDDDVLGSDVLHGGDLDGVDIDDLDSDDDDPDDDDDFADDDDDESDDDDAESDRSY